MTTSQHDQDGLKSNGQEAGAHQKSNQMSTLHPSFLPPCSHPSAGEDGLHAHAFDLLALHNPSLADASTNPAKAQPQPRAVSASISTGTQRPRRMSSSTTAALGRGKTGLLGTSVGAASGESSGLGLGGVTRTSGRTITPSLTRRASAATGPTPVLFDFAKTDSTRSSRPALPSHSYSQPGPRNAKFGASLPASSAGYMRAASAAQDDSMELDMDFDDDDEVVVDDDEDGSGSAEREGSVEDAEKPAYEKLALGTGSGGVKGRRKGMVFKCENCSKEYRHPSCLVKHRWEHSPHWKEPTQLSMSKHQQVQMLEAAAILMHMDPTGASGRSLPSDKSLWPAVLSPPPNNAALTRSGRSSTRELPNVRSPPPSTVPLTPSSLRSGSPMVSGRPHRQSFGQASQGRKTSPGSDSTTSSTGIEAQDDYAHQSQPRGIETTEQSRFSRRGSSLSSSIPNLATPNSVGSMPDMAGLHFHSGTTPVSRNAPLPGSASRTGMVGGGMFGLSSSSYGLNASVPRSSVSSVRGGFDGALHEEEEEEEEVTYRRGYNARGKSSSEEIEDKKALHEEDGWAAGTGMDLDMEL